MSDYNIKIKVTVLVFEYSGSEGASRRFQDADGIDRYARTFKSISSQVYQ
jgi:hypothetical protein